MSKLSDPQFIAFLFAIVVSLMLVALGLTVVRAMWRGDIRLTHLLSEPVLPGESQDVAKASLSRFQFLVFTFVIAGLYFVLSLETGALIDVPEGTLILLGISSATYVGSKAMQNSRSTAPDDKPVTQQGNTAQQDVAPPQNTPASQTRTRTTK